MLDREPIILLDCDSVLVEHNATHITMVNEKFGTDYSFSDVTDFDYLFMTKDERDYVLSLWERPDIYDNDELTDEQVRCIQDLREVGRVIACTSPLAGHITSKYNFLSRYFHRRDIVMCSDKYLVGGDILVDDAPHNIIDFAKTGEVIIFDKPWNQELEGRRVSNFSELRDAVFEMFDTHEDDDLDELLLEFETDGFMVLDDFDDIDWEGDDELW